MRNLFQRAGNAVRNVAGRIRSAFFSRRLAFLRLLIFPMEVIVMRPRYVQGEFDFLSCRRFRSRESLQRLLDIDSR